FNCREHTTEVSDPAETRELLQLVEYLPLVRVKKTRRKAKQGHTAICLDQVEGLGNFIEVEMLFDDGTDVDASEQQEKMKDFLGQLGISEDQIVKDGYDVMVYEKESGTDRQAA
ncbi:MAG: CYTH domain-containing protein, partial [Gammaproteobacteria bacterium]|nr:CYTH domain-containing protein [Gammaproteobacteria bacterium]